MSKAGFTQSQRLEESRGGKRQRTIRARKHTVGDTSTITRASVAVSIESYTVASGRHTDLAHRNSR